MGTTAAAEAYERGRALEERLEREDAELVGELCHELESARRQLLRLGLDLHDGPLQAIAALGTDLHLFRSQLASLLEDETTAARALGRIDDLVARLSGLDAELREIGISAEAGSLLRGSLSGALADSADAYTEFVDVTLDLDERLDEAAATDSQRIALIRIAQSALANIARHSRASCASLVVRVTAVGLLAEIADDGCGFDVDEATRRAATHGRVGLSGMRERVRLLGGTLDVASRPGHGTTIRVSLPHFIS